MKIRNNRLINKVLNVYCNKFCDKKEHLELRYTGYQDLKDQVPMTMSISYWHPVNR